MLDGPEAGSSVRGHPRARFLLVCCGVRLGILSLTVLSTLAPQCPGHVGSTRPRLFTGDLHCGCAACTPVGPLLASSPGPFPALPAFVPPSEAGAGSGHLQLCFPCSAPTWMGVRALGRRARLGPWAGAGEAEARAPTPTPLPTPQHHVH